MSRAISDLEWVWNLGGNSFGSTFVVIPSQILSFIRRIYSPRFDDKFSNYERTYRNSLGIWNGYLIKPNGAEKTSKNVKKCSSRENSKYFWMDAHLFLWKYFGIFDKVIFFKCVTIQCLLNEKKRLSFGQ